jgi:hypothetical protein
MNEHGEIYRALGDDIPPEDKARLDGYLQGRADEAVETARLREQAAGLRAELELQMQAEHERQVLDRNKPESA